MTDMLYRDSVTLICVAIEKAKRARQTRLGVHDKADTPRLGEISLS